MPVTTSTALPSLSHDQHHETDAANWKGGEADILVATSPGPSRKMAAEMKRETGRDVSGTSDARSADSEAMMSYQADPDSTSANIDQSSTSPSAHADWFLWNVFPWLGRLWAL